jgi:hypothetical protein
MPEPTTAPLALEATALRYAARDLTPRETAEFEARLAVDQSARDALAEALRLSAAALDQEAPTPDRSLRAAIRSRLRSRGHPIAWAGIGAGIMAAAALFGVQLADRPDSIRPVAALPPASPAVAIAPEPHLALHVAVPDEPPPAIENPDDMRKMAEIWAEFSTAEHVEKAHEDEARLQQLFQSLRPSTGLDSREP